jgi:hypothetical protein
VPSLVVGASEYLRVLVSIPPSDGPGLTTSLIDYLIRNELPRVMHLKFKDALGKRTFVREFSVEGNRDGIAFLPISINIL